MTRFNKIIHLVETNLSREDWLEENNLSEKDIYEDDEGQFYVDYVEIELDETGGTYENKIYLPPNI